MSCAPGWCAETAGFAGQAQLLALSDKLQANGIQKVEILWMSPSAESRNTITPDVLDKLYFRKAIVLASHAPVQFEGLALAVNATTLSEMNPQSEGDVRWAIKFYGKRRAVPEVSIYLDGSGETGFVGPTPYSFNGPLYKWLNNNFFLFTATERRIGAGGSLLQTEVDIEK